MTFEQKVCIILSNNDVIRRLFSECIHFMLRSSYARKRLPKVHVTQYSFISNNQQEICSSVDSRLVYIIEFFIGRYFGEILPEMNSFSNNALINNCWLTTIELDMFSISTLTL